MPVAPGISAPLCLHWYARPALFVVTENVTDCHRHLVAPTGWLRIAGSTVTTVNVAAVELTVPHVLVNTARYLFPVSAVVTAMVSEDPVAPLRLVKVAPPLVLPCH